MKIEDLKKFEDKQVRIVLRDGKFFHGKIILLSSDHLIFRDKFKQDVLIVYASISTIYILGKAEVYRNV